MPVTTENGIDPVGIVWENRGEGDDVLTGLLPDGRRITPPDVLKRGDVIVMPRGPAADPSALYIITDVWPDGAVGFNPYYAGGLTWTETPWGDVIWNLQENGMRLATDREREQGTADPGGPR